VFRLRTALRALLPFLLHGLAREVDRALGLVLRAEVEPETVLGEVVRAMGAEGVAAAGRVAIWVVAGCLAWGALAAWRARRAGLPFTVALAREASGFSALYLRPALTLVALASVAAAPSFPYGFTLPVALTQDWGIGQDAAALAALAPLHAPSIRLPPPGPGAVWLIAFLTYAHLAPEGAWRWEGHPGNEPKYLRMAVAIGHGFTLDAEGVSASMEELEVKPLPAAVADAASFLGRESARMGAGLVQGPAAVGREAIRATRLTRQTIRGKEGGVYYVLAPGPSVLLAPALRVDRAINRLRGTTGRLAVSVLAWNALAALLVAALFVLVRDATGRAGLAAVLAFGFALLPPFLFYSFQFYPEMPGALALATAFHALALRREWVARHPWLLGWLLAVLPWLHQKFLPAWIVLVVTAALLRPSGAGRRRWLVGLLVPQLFGLYLTALYNFAITGSARPDALFLAWGPGGVTTARMGQGLLGLLLDARYGLLPYVPVLIAAIAGLALGGARRFAVVLPAAAVYYLTVASADNWAGAVSNLGRYVMPVAPLAVGLLGMAVARASARRGAVALVLILAVWSALLALALWRDPHAANDCALLLAKSTWADGHQYIPNLFLRQWSEGAPGLLARTVAWLVAIGVVTAWLQRTTRATEGARGAGSSPTAVLSAVAAVLLALAFGLERWPGTRTAPAFHGALATSNGTLVFVQGKAHVGPDEAVLGPGAVELLARAPTPVASLRATVGGRGVLRAPGIPPLILRPAGAVVDLPLAAHHTVHGREGRTAAFSRTTFSVEGEAVLRLGEGTTPAPSEREPPIPDNEGNPGRPDDVQG